ncbi:hypothetical protein ACWGR4_40455 [Embleya sp. NPDC055664]
MSLVTTRRTNTVRTLAATAKAGDNTPPPVPATPPATAAAPNGPATTGPGPRTAPR